MWKFKKINTPNFGLSQTLGLENFKPKTQKLYICPPDSSACKQRGTWSFIHFNEATESSTVLAPAV